MYKRLIFLIFSVVNTVYGFAQSSVLASIDTTEMHIGEQTHIKLEVNTTAKDTVSFPTFEDNKLIDGISIIKESNIDTLKSDKSRLSLIREYTITAFDSSLYYIPPFEVKINSEIYKSKSLALKVITVPVDTLNFDKYFGPKGVVDPLFSWEEWATPFYGSILLVILVLLFFYLLSKQKKAKSIVKYVTLPPALSPHEQAYKDLELLSPDDMDVKTYYTSLSSILRNYLASRYEFSATEMVTTEIKEHLEHLENFNQNKLVDELLALSDLVKFAKFKTTLNDNKSNATKLRTFVDITKMEVVMKPQIIKVNLNEKKQARKRLFFRFSILLNAVLIIAMLVFVIMNLIKII